MKEIMTYSPMGILGGLVSVEVDIRRSIPGIDIVGLPGHSIREARERIRAALKNQGFKLPQKRILINLSPSDQKKNGTGFDLPMALGILLKDQGEGERGATLVFGELGLGGEVKSAPGVISAVLAAQDAGITRFLVPQEDLDKVIGLVEGQILGVESLAQAYEDFTNAQGLISQPRGLSPRERGGFWNDLILSPKEVKLAQIILTASHSLLLVGPPGAGKTTFARGIRDLRAHLSMEGKAEVLKIWSMAQVPWDEILTDSRIPWREPHHSASREGLLGGGALLTPGEISLAHRGMLFLDEGLEFSHSFWQSLREPMEAGCIHHARAGQSHQFPADFQLLVSTNPCPCGNYGSRHHSCLCSAQEIQRYWARMGGALLDRLEIRFWMDQQDHSPPAPRAPLVMERVQEAKKIRPLIPSPHPSSWGRSRREERILGSLSKTLCALEGRTQVLPRDLEEAREWRLGIGAILPWF